MDKEVVKELIQHELTVENLKRELQELLTNEKKKQQLEKDYAALLQLLIEGGNASANAAGSIYEFMMKKEWKFGSPKLYWVCT